MISQMQKLNGCYKTLSSFANLRSLSSFVNPQWIFLGPPGVGKGTYSKRIAEYLQVPQISTGDLVREEVSKGTSLGKQMNQMCLDGKLLPDQMILELLKHRLETARNGFVLDGFPRTVAQAELLSQLTNVHLVVNLDLREEVLVGKCLGRRICSKCKRDFNVADIYLKSENGKSEIVMPPLMPPKECLHYMRPREDDKEEIIKKRIEVYRKEAHPIEEFYRTQGLLLDYEITGGIPQTLPSLLRLLEKHIPSSIETKSKCSMVA